MVVREAVQFNSWDASAGEEGAFLRSFLVRASALSSTPFATAVRDAALAATLLAFALPSSRPQQPDHSGMAAPRCKRPPKSGCLTCGGLTCGGLTCGLLTPTELYPLLVSAVAMVVSAACQLYLINATMSSGKARAPSPHDCAHLSLHPLHPLSTHRTHTRTHTRARARHLPPSLSLPLPLPLSPVSYTHLRAHETLMNL
eukprot:2466300-Prymnesium_polylepis.1